MTEKVMTFAIEAGEPKFFLNLVHTFTWETTYFREAFIENAKQAKNRPTLLPKAHPIA
jgi:hypothetical protein